jgi:nucleoside-diphosphate-sugar epimerase
MRSSSIARAFLHGKLANFANSRRLAGQALGMRVFLTGANGFVGSAIVKELVGAGHKVLGMVRSDEAAKQVAAAGAEVQKGTLEDLEGLKQRAAACDGVIHTAFIHDFKDFVASSKVDREAVVAMGSVLKGSNKPFIITSGTAGIAMGRVATESDRGDLDKPASPRLATEHVHLALAKHGVCAQVMRLPPSVHGDGDHGFVPLIVKAAREHKVSPYIGDGANRWSAVHRLDAALAYRLALEQGEPGSVWHAIGDQAVTTKHIATVIGTQLNVPVTSITAEAAPAHFGFLAMFFAWDMQSSAAITKQKLGWAPTHVGLIEDLENGTYFTT